MEMSSVEFRDDVCVFQVKYGYGVLEEFLLKISDIPVLKWSIGLGNKIQALSCLGHTRIVKFLKYISECLILFVYLSLEFMLK